MKIEWVDYAVHERKYAIAGCGYSDRARFIFHIGTAAFHFGQHDGRTLVVECLTTGFMLRFRLLQTVPSQVPG